MKAMVVPQWGERSRLEERPDPAPQPGEAVMRVRAAGVGLTLLNMRSGRSGGTTPRIMGHELGGDIVAVGEGVRNVKVGDRCSVYFYLTCGHCRWCRGGRETLCEDHRGYVGVHRDGGFAELVCLPAENLIPLPEGLDYEAAAIAADAVNTNWHCMRERARITPHDTVLMIGAGGGVGIHGVQVARLFGARVIAADVSEEKLALARQYGAEETINVSSLPDIAAEARRLTGGKGVDAAIDYAGYGPTFQAAIESLGTGGRAVIIGAGQGDVTFNGAGLIGGEHEIMGSRHSTRAEFIETLNLMARGLVQPVVGRRVHFTEVESLFDDIMEKTLLGRGALTYD
jgi:alcohol dehydrogenase, propanol-preferring